MKINIVGGNGMMGRVHKVIFEKYGHEVICTGRNSEITPEEAAKTSDLTVISVPIHAVVDTIKRIAPNCKAIMDFTGIKEEAVKAMLKFSSKKCEVAGLHPLYGEVSSINGRAIIFNKTKRTGKLCEQIVDVLKKEGAIIKEMTPKEHDIMVSAIMQNARTLLLESYAKLLKKNGINIIDFYEISSPPAKIVLELVARQVDAQSDEMYNDMKNFNKYQKKIDKQLVECMKEISKQGHNSKEIREAFGKDLQRIQENAKKRVN